MEINHINLKREILNDTLKMTIVFSLIVKHVFEKHFTIVVALFLIATSRAKK